MDEKTRKSALEKIDSMTIHSAYPNELLDDKKLIDYYESLEIDNNSYLKSVINIRKFITIRRFKNYRKPVNKSDWTTHGDSFINFALALFKDNSIGKFYFIDLKVVLL